VDRHHSRLCHVSDRTHIPIERQLILRSILFGLPAGAYGSGNAYMEEEFDISQENFPTLYWATTSWNIGAAFWPLIFVPMTENSGRMPGYFVSHLFFEDCVVQI